MSFYLWAKHQFVILLILNCLFPYLAAHIAHIARTCWHSHAHIRRGE